MNKIIESIQAVMDKVDVLELGGTLSPAVYILALGAILVIITFFIALAIKSGSKANKLRKHLDDTVAYVNANGTVDAENVDGLNARIQAKQMPLSVKRGWGVFLEQQTGYPSDYITENDCLGARKGNPNYKTGKGFYKVVGSIVILACILLSAISCYDVVKGIDVASVEGIKGIVLLVLPVLGTLVVPWIVYVIFGAFLNLAGKNEYKKVQQSFRKFQDALDTNVIIFRETQDEFISENIEEINAAIEDILASKLGDSEILEIVTTPKVDESLVIEEETPVIEPIAVEPEVAAVVDEVPMTEEEQRELYLVQLVNLTIKVAEDPALDEQTLVEFAEYLDGEVTSGNYSQEELDIFLDCLAVCAGIYDEKFAK